MLQNGLTPVTFERHGHRFWRRFTSYDFARHLTECTVVEAEILQVAAMFPIAFRMTPVGCQPVALLSMQVNSATPFVAANGTWLARYLPTALRCPPFGAGSASATSGQQFHLLVDETMGLVTDNPDDVCFFDDAKRLNCDLTKVKSFLFQRAAAEHETLELCRLIRDLNLLSPLSEVLKADGPHGLFGIHLQAIHGLRSTHRAVLTNSRAMRLIHAHQVSLSHVQWLRQIQDQLTDRSQLQTSSEVSGFLDAVVNAQLEEIPFNCDKQGGAYAYA